jgi:hypothetical protein
MSILIICVMYLVYCIVSNYQCFKTRPGGLTRVCGWAGSKQKTGWELARPDPVNPAGRPGTRPARANPAETRVFFFFDIFMTETTSFWPFTLIRPKQDEQRNERSAKVRLWEDLINFKPNSRNLQTHFKREEEERSRRLLNKDRCFKSENKVRWAVDRIHFSFFFRYPLFQIETSFKDSSLYWTCRRALL